MNIAKLIILFLIILFAGCGNDSRNILGSSGGTFTMNGVTVIIPPNAIDRGNIEFTVEKIPPVGNALASFRLEPSMQFSRPVTLILPFDQTKAQNESQLRLGYLNEKTNKYEILPSIANTKNNTVSGQTTHFSTFGVVPMDEQTQREIALRLIEMFKNIGIDINLTDSQLEEILRRARENHPFADPIANIKEIVQDGSGDHSGSIDLRQLTTEVQSSFLVWDLQFVFTGDLGIPVVTIPIDIDSNFQTGVTNVPALDVFNKHQLGVEYFVLVAPGILDVLIIKTGTGSTPQGGQVIEATENNLKFAVPFTSLGNDEGDLKYAVELQTTVGAGFDIIPNINHLSLFAPTQSEIPNLSGFWNINTTVDLLDQNGVTIQGNNFNLNTNITHNFDPVPPGILDLDSGIFNITGTNGQDIKGLQYLDVVKFRVKGEIPSIGIPNTIWEIDYHGKVDVTTLTLQGNFRGKSVFPTQEFFISGRFTVNITDVTGPTVEITNLPQVVSENFIFQAKARDTQSSIHFILVGIDSFPSFLMAPLDGLYDSREEEAFFPVDITNLSDGTHFLSVQAFDIFTNASEIVTVPFEVRRDQKPPTIDVLSPQNNVIVVPSKTLVFDFTVFDESGVNFFFANIEKVTAEGRILVRSIGIHEEILAFRLGEGNFFFTVVAIDVFGNTATKEVPFQIVFTPVALISTTDQLITELLKEKLTEDQRDKLQEIQKKVQKLLITVSGDKLKAPELFERLVNKVNEINRELRTGALKDLNIDELIGAFSSLAVQVNAIPKIHKIKVIPTGFDPKDKNGDDDDEEDDDDDKKKFVQPVGATQEFRIVLKDKKGNVLSPSQFPNWAKPAIKSVTVTNGFAEIKSLERENLTWISECTGEGETREEVKLELVPVEALTGMVDPPVVETLGLNLKTSFTFLQEKKPKIVFLDSNKKEVSSDEGLKIAKWDKAFTFKDDRFRTLEISKDLHKDDQDRFVMQIHADTDEASIKATIITRDIDGEKVDEIKDISLTRVKDGVYESEPFILVFSEADDNFRINNVEDGTSKDRSLLIFNPEKVRTKPDKIKAGGKVEITEVIIKDKQIKLSDNNSTSICPASGKIPLITIDIRVFVFFDPDDPKKEKPLVTDEEIRQSIALANIIWSQCCIHFNLKEIKKITFQDLKDKGLQDKIDLKNGLELSKPEDFPKLSNEELALIKGFQDDDKKTIEMFIITDFDPENIYEGLSYIRKRDPDKLTDATAAIAIPAKFIGFTTRKSPKHFNLVAHELGHVLFDTGDHTDIQLDGQPDGKTISFKMSFLGAIAFQEDKFLKFILASETTNNNFEIESASGDLNKTLNNVITKLNSATVNIKGTLGMKEVTVTVKLTPTRIKGVISIPLTIVKIDGADKDFRVIASNKRYDFSSKASLTVLDYLNLTNILAAVGVKKTDAVDLDKKITALQCEIARIFGK